MTEHLFTTFTEYFKPTAEVVFMCANTTSVLQPIDQRVTLTFKCYLRNTFCKATVAIYGNASDGSRQNKLKAIWKGFTILDAIKNIHDSWEKVKISTLTEVRKKLISTLMGEF